MAKSTSVRYIISPDGRTITEQVEGVKGNQCAVITSSIEDALGIVTSRKPTSDFFNDDKRFENLEEEDWRILPNRLENLEEEDWR